MNKMPSAEALFMDAQIKHGEAQEEAGGGGKQAKRLKTLSEDGPVVETKEATDLQTY